MQRIFGGYTDIQWTSGRREKYGWKTGPGNSFLFTLRDDMNFIKLRCTHKKCEVIHKEFKLCCFGSDLFILSDCNINYNSQSELGHCYKYPSDLN